ncbi:MAG TPA: SPOR domain-containing protein [Rhizomicrobium sp.]|jgi:cell division protein FtsN|nr:SPOR domain-containing protein [Rhizomicrobium sp.]
MAKIEPNTFRAQDRVPAFDDMEEDDEEEGSRLPLLIVIALLVLAAFGGVVWLAYNQGVQKGRADAPRPLVAETQSDRSSALKVYEQPAPPDQDSGDADSVPQPPTETKPAPQAAAAPPPVAQTTTPATQEPAIEAPPLPKPKPLVAAPPQQLVTPKPKPVEAAPLATPAMTSTPAATGSYVLQIGAYKSEDEAKSAWKSYQRKHPMLGGYEPDVKQADLADKGTWYRLRVGAFPTKDAAAALCTRLKADGGDCLLAKK